MGKKGGGKGKKGGKSKGKEAKAKEPFVPPWKQGKPLWYTQGLAASTALRPLVDDLGQWKTGIWTAAGLDEAKLKDVRAGALPTLSRPSTRGSAQATIPQDER